MAAPHRKGWHPVDLSAVLGHREWELELRQGLSEAGRPSTAVGARRRGPDRMT